jgi:hypothetical protein
MPSHDAAPGTTADQHDFVSIGCYSRSSIGFDWMVDRDNSLDRIELRSTHDDLVGYGIDWAILGVGEEQVAFRLPGEIIGDTIVADGSSIAGHG